MGFDNFYANTGQVQVLDCTVRKFVFDNLNTTYYDKVYTGINSEFREIIWLYVSNDATECDKYVVFNLKITIGYMEIPSSLPLGIEKYLEIH